MPKFSGDVPITTFFPYKSSTIGNKRKTNPRPVASSSSKKQKKEKPNTKASGSAEDFSFARESLSDPSSTVYAHPNGGDEIDFGLPPDTPHIKSLKKRKVVDSLQTPPTTIERPFRQCSTRARESANNSCPSLPTPTTLPRAQPYLPQSPVLNVNDTSWKPMNNYIPTPSPSSFSHNGTLYNNSDLPDSPKSYRCVPSSQSQDGPESCCQLSALPASSTPRRRWKDSPNLSMPLNANPQISTTTPQRKTRSIRFSSAADYDLVILSSQSQLLDPLDTSPRTERSATNADSDAEILVERVPSSQAHETEHMAPTKDSPSLKFDNYDSRHGSSTSTFPSHRMPPRTLSDELFSIPIRRNVLAGIFTKNQSSNSISHVEDSITKSETESETESEGEHISARSVNGLTTSKASKQAIRFPLSGNLTHHRPGSSQQLSEPDLGSSSASLPHPFVDFHDMFESNDESYPPDFPTSLRI